MTALALPSTVADIFAPIPKDGALELIEYRKRTAAQLYEVSALLLGSERTILDHFMHGNAGDRSSHDPENLFRVAGALKSLDAACWEKLIRLTDVYDVMPGDARKAWNTQIEKMDAVEFTPTNVMSTLQAWWVERPNWFAAQVHEAWGALSRGHVTNPSAHFGERMILDSIVTGGAFGHSAGYAVDYLHSLRQAICKLAGREPARAGNTRHVVECCASIRPGQWVSIDGGLMRIKVFAGAGTAHLDVRPDIVVALNMVLAHHSGGALGQQPKRSAKKGKKRTEWKLMSRPLTSAVVHEFSSAFRHNGHGVQKAGDAWSLAFGFYKVDAAVRREVARVVRTLGGVWKGGSAWFDFNPREILFDLISSGCVPDQASHQFYPTPKSLAQRMVLKANVRAGERVLEPSAGTGSLAAEVLRACPEAELTCVEVSPFFAKACSAKLATVQGASTWSVDVGDFLALPIDTYDVVIMNPPFADGRWEAHLARAWEHVRGNAGARLVAMLPASAKRVVEGARADGGLFAGTKVSWSEVFEGEFVGTSVSTIILRVEVV